MTSEGIGAFQGMKNLEGLFLQGEAGSRSIAKLRYRRLKSLGLVDATLTPMVVNAISEMTDLTSLSLAHSDLNDEDLAKLKVLGKLQNLELEGTKVSGAGLQHLGVLTELMNLTVYESQATADDVEKLRRRLPGCRILRLVKNSN